MGRRIAIVEDEPAIRDNYADALRRHGYDVAAYATRDAALFLEHVGFDDGDEVPDPYYGSRKDFAHVLDLARRGSALLIERLARERERKRA